MSRTLLYTVERVLEKLDLDPVNSINDSTDALLVAREAETTFYDMMNRADWPEKKELIDLQSVGDTNNPTALRLDPETVEIYSLRYDVTEAGETGKDIREITKLTPEDFLDHVYSRNVENTEVDEVTYNGRPLFIINDQMPTYYTSFDNEYLILDSYHSTTESTLQGDKAICHGKILPSWTEDDDFIIPLQDNLYPLYISELTAACSYYLNGVASAEDERRRNRAISRMRRDSIRTEKLNTNKNYFGRNGNGLS